MFAKGTFVPILAMFWSEANILIVKKFRNLYQFQNVLPLLDFPRL